MKWGKKPEKYQNRKWLEIDVHCTDNKGIVILTLYKLELIYFSITYHQFRLNASVFIYLSHRLCCKHAIIHHFFTIIFLLYTFFGFSRFIRCADIDCSISIDFKPNFKNKKYFVHENFLCCLHIVVNCIQFSYIKIEWK